MNKETENQTSEFVREIWKKSKRFCKDENCDAPQYIEVNEVFEIINKYIEDLQKKAELGEHYKHLYSELKKQKDDVVEFINKRKAEDGWLEVNSDRLLRMLGETDDK